MSNVKVTGTKTKKCGILFGSRAVERRGRGPRVAFFQERSSGSRSSGAMRAAYVWWIVRHFYAGGKISACCLVFFSIFSGWMLHGSLSKVLRGSLFTQFLSMAISWSHISQGKVATYLRCVGIFRNLLLNQAVKEFWKSVRFDVVWYMAYAYFLEHSVCP